MKKQKYPFKEKFGKNVWIWVKPNLGHWEKIHGLKQICDICTENGTKLYRICPCPHFKEISKHFSEMGKKSWAIKKKKLLNDEELLKVL
jgi:hypothetical protein